MLEMSDLCYLGKTRNDRLRIAQYISTEGNVFLDGQFSSAFGCESDANIVNFIVMKKFIRFRKSEFNC